MITEVWHIPTNYEVRRAPLYPSDPTQPVEVWVGTYPTELGQSVWVCWQEFDSAGNLIADQRSLVVAPEDPPNPLHYARCNWIYENSDDNSYWCAKIGPFSPEARRVVYNIFARQGTKVVTISSPDYFDFSLSDADGPPVPAPGAPGPGGSWASGAKEGVCTAYSDESRVWLSLARGAVNEVYFPQLDTPCIRDFQFLVLDGAGAFNDPQRCDSKVEYLDTLAGGDGTPRALAYRITNFDATAGGAAPRRYELSMDVLTDPNEHSVLLNMRYRALLPAAASYRVFAMLNPSISNSGASDSCKFVRYKNLLMSLVWENGIYCALAVNRPIGKHQCGFSGLNDGWQDLKAHGDLTYPYNQASNGDVVGTLEILLSPTAPNALVTLSFGQSEEDALSRAYRTVSKDFNFVREQFVSQWNGYISNLETNGSLKAICQGQSALNTKLAYVSVMCLKAMEDKLKKGAIIASMSIPWGQCKDGVHGGYHADNAGGYHLVWGRDLYNMATSALAVGDFTTALSILDYFDATMQENNGSMPQNTWIDGTPYWKNEQLDETAYPMILAWRLKELGKLDVQRVRAVFASLVAPAGDFLASYEHTWTQDRWEEVVGRSPFTVAVVVAGLIVSANWAEQLGDATRAARWRAKAKDFAINDLSDCYLTNAGQSYLTRVFNPWDAYFSKFQIDIDGGFLELVRLGVKSPQNAQITSSLAVVDQRIRKQINGFPYYLRYGRVDGADDVGKDTYGETDDGKCWTGSGRGRYWPLLSGERGHYELVQSGSAAAQLYLDAMAASANEGLMLPEQIWDLPGIARDEHGAPLVTGKGTKSATPLGWTHGEFLKLMRSIHDNAIFDRLPEVVQFCQANHLF